MLTENLDNDSNLIYLVTTKFGLFSNLFYT